MRIPPSTFSMLAGVAIVATGCKRPPEAPAELDELCAFMFTHAADEDPAAMQDAMVNLEIWVDENPGLTEEGYQVQNLEAEALGELDDQERTAEGLAGATVTSTAPYTPSQVGYALVVPDQTEIFEDLVSYERTENTSDFTCFGEGDCPTLDFTLVQVTSLPLSIEISSNGHGQFRWIETAGGPAFVTRAWLNESADVSVDWLQIDAQYYMTITIPTADGTLLRLQATWADATVIGASLPEGTALNMLINGFKSRDEELFAWMAANP